ANLRADVAGQTDRQALASGLHDLAGQLLVPRIDVGVEKADGETFHLVRTQFLDNGIERGSLERHQYVAARGKAFRHGKAKLAGNERRTLLQPQVHRVVATLVADLQDVPKSVGRQKRRARTAPLDQHVRRKRRPVDEP